MSDATEMTLCTQAPRLFARGISAPVRDWREGGAAAWLAGTLAGPRVQGPGLPPPQELQPYQSLFVSPKFKVKIM